MAGSEFLIFGHNFYSRPVTGSLRPYIEANVKQIRAAFIRIQI